MRMSARPLKVVRNLDSRFRGNDRMGKKWPLVAGGLAGLGLALCAATAHAADLYGRVYDTLRSSLYPGAVVMLRTSAGRELETVADTAAQFRFAGVQPGVYRVRVLAGDREV